MAMHVSSQIQPYITRGHINDDLYVYCYDGNESILFYLTSDGGTIKKQSSSLIASSDFTTETIPGKVIGHSPEWFSQSNDYGKTFPITHFFIDQYTSIVKLFGGEVPGEYVIEGFDPTVWPNSGIVFYKTLDNFNTYSLIADSCDIDSCIAIEIGSVSGELYFLNQLNGYAFLSHSIDFGITFDTTPVDTTIINANLGLKFRALCHGSTQGELYLVTQNDLSVSNFQYSIFYSNNFGASWEMKTSYESNSNIQAFSAGRGSCKFYIADLVPTPGSEYYTLKIYYSTNCGLTFDYYDHLLSPDVGILVHEDVKEYVRICPNPVINKVNIEYTFEGAGQVTLEIYSFDGKTIASLNEDYKIPGTYNVQFDNINFKAGIYIVSLITEKGVIASAKFIISE